MHWLSVLTAYAGSLFFDWKPFHEADFGCEERPEGQETMVGIRLKAEDGEEIHRQEADAELYAKNINEGDKVIFIEGRIEKQC